MVKYSLQVAAMGALLALGGVPQALAGDCCPGPVACPCGPVCVAVPTPIYVVNQGPVFSGPGPMISQIPDYAPRPYPGAYPYVGFVYSGYPYGYYAPWVGEPAPYRVARPYWRLPAPAYPRYFSK